MTADIKFIFNKKKIDYLLRFNQPKKEDFDTPSFKGVEFLYAYKYSNQYIRDILDSIKLERNHRYLCVDVKVHDLKAGERPTINDWHTDVTLNPFHEGRPEVHYLLVTGQHCLPKFIHQPIELEVNPKTYNQQIEKFCPGWIYIPTCTLIKYGRFDFHSASVATAPGKRILVKVTETDVIRPVNQTYNPFKIKIYD